MKKILKERNDKMKNSKGITLVALIITIVVLLILAVVSIGAIQNSKIIAHAQNAASIYNQAQINEITLLEQVEDYINASISNKQNGEEPQTTTRIYMQEGSTSKYIITSDDEGDKITMIMGETQMGPYPITYETNLEEYGYTMIGESIANPRFIVANLDGVETAAGLVLTEDWNKLYQGDTDSKIFYMDSNVGCFELVTE